MGYCLRKRRLRSGQNSCSTLIPMSTPMLIPKELAPAPTVARVRGIQAREMKAAIEAIGADTIGVCLDSGNPVWMLEDPHMTLETLIPYALTCHVRDSAVWKVPEGIAVRWVNMGDGNVDIDGQRSSGIQLRARQFQVAVFELRIGQAVAERVQRLSLEVAISTILHRIVFEGRKLVS